MAELKVELSGNDINTAVADAIVKSVLGDAIVKAVNERVQDVIRGGYNNPLKQVIDSVIHEKVRELISVHEATMVEELHKQLSGDAVKRIVSAAVDKLTKHL